MTGSNRNWLPIIAVVAVAIVLSGFLGYALGASGFTTSINGPGQTGTVTVTPNGVLITGFSMNWTTLRASVTLQNTGSNQVTSKITLTFENSTAVLATASQAYSLAAGSTLGFFVQPPQGPNYFQTVLINIQT